MSQGPIPEPPSIGEIRYFDSIKPPLTQGDYRIEMKQEVSTRHRYHFHWHESIRVSKQILYSKRLEVEY